jgi:uncharacterized protein YbjT (DUF2867 family)
MFLPGGNAMIVILGAFGRTGRVVTELTRKRAGGVRLVTRKPRASSQPGTEVAVARLTDERALEQAFRGARALFALLPDDFGAKAFHAERRAMADAVVAAVRSARVPRVVLLSSSAAALGESAPGALGADLAYFERMLHRTDAAVSVLRACYFQENVLEARPMAEREGSYPNFLPPGCSIPTVAAADVAAIAAAQLFTLPGTEGEVIDVVGPRYTPEQMAELLGAALARRLTLAHVPALAQTALLAQWMSPEAACAMVATFAQLGGGRVPLTGTRIERTTTSLEHTLRAALARAPSSTPEVA